MHKVAILIAILLAIFKIAFLSESARGVRTPKPRSNFLRLLKQNYFKSSSNKVKIMGAFKAF